MQDEPAHKPDANRPKPLVEDEDYYFENGLMVLTRRYLLDRGYCCENGCRHCPYGYQKAEGLE
jgi:hypothetical protein